MRDIDKLLNFIEELLYHQTGNYLSDLQYTILVNSLTQSRKTYDEIAQESSYSAKYIKQDVAPKLWQLLSQILGQKVTKQNVQAILRSQLSLEQKTPKIALGHASLEHFSSVILKKKAQYSLNRRSTP